MKQFKNKTNVLFMTKSGVIIQYLHESRIKLLTALFYSLLIAHIAGGTATRISFQQETSIGNRMKTHRFR